MTQLTQDSHLATSLNNLAFLPAVTVHWVRIR